MPYSRSVDNSILVNLVRISYLWAASWASSTSFSCFLFFDLQEAVFSLLMLVGNIQLSPREMKQA